MRKFFRRLYWRWLLKPYLVRRVSEYALGYPLLVYLAFQGEEDFVRVGKNGFDAVWEEKVEDYKKRLDNLFQDLNPPAPGEPGRFAYLRRKVKEIQEQEAEEQKQEEEEKQEWVDKFEQQLKEQGYEY